MEIEARDLVVRFGSAALFEGVDLAVRGGEMIGLVGPERLRQDDAVANSRQPSCARRRPGAL